MATVQQPRRFPRDLQQAAAGTQTSPNHLGPARAHLRAQTDKLAAKAVPSGSFPQRLSAFLQFQVWGVAVQLSEIPIWSTP